MTGILIPVILINIPEVGGSRDRTHVRQQPLSFNAAAWRHKMALDVCRGLKIAEWWPWAWRERSD